MKLIHLCRGDCGEGAIVVGVEIEDAGFWGDDPVFGDTVAGRIAQRYWIDAGGA
jgi:hypothetical protein